MPQRHRTSEDPVTVIGLIYRIVDEPRRAFALNVVLMPVLAAVVQSVAPASGLLEFHAPAVWCAGGGALGLGWLSRVTARRIREGLDLPRVHRRMMGHDPGFYD